MPAANQIVIDGYQASASGLIEQFDAISAQDLYEPVADFIDQAPKGRLIDIGAGTGRDAAWFDAKGFDVTAVEPVSFFRQHGKSRHKHADIDWVNDRLPALATLRNHVREYDVVNVTAVWHHLTDHERRTSFRRITSLTRSGGTIIMSLRHGPSLSDRPSYDVDVDETIVLARRHQFELLHRAETSSVQSNNIEAGVHWTWLVLKALF